MYLFIGILTIACLFSAVSTYLNACRKSGAMQKVKRLSQKEKSQILSNLTAPAGFSYDEEQDIFVSRIDAWQRHYGYSGLFDKSAPFFQMTLDCEPIYFDYEGKTWMIELWKGQYGITSGCEAGIYKAASVLEPSQRSSAHFAAAENDEMLPIRVALHKKNKTLFQLSRRHWWLAGFSIGLYSRPEDLSMTVSITFPNQEMIRAFSDSLMKNSHCRKSLRTAGRTAVFSFDAPTSSQPRKALPVRSAISQWKNRLLCKTYLRITRPFSRNDDRLLYLYYFLPFAFRKIIGGDKR